MKFNKPKVDPKYCVVFGNIWLPKKTLNEKMYYYYFFLAIIQKTRQSQLQKC